MEMQLLLILCIKIFSFYTQKIQLVAEIPGNSKLNYKTLKYGN